MILFHDSAWSFETSAGGALGYGLFMASGGMLRLRDPSNKPVTFHFGGAGVAASLPSVKIPRLPAIKLPSLGAGFSTTNNFSTGVIYRKSLFGGNELTANDFRGSCIYIEGGLSLIKGISGDIMFFGADAAFTSGLNTLALAVGPATALLASSNGVIAWLGTSQGIQAGAGIGALIGYVH